MSFRGTTDSDLAKAVAVQHLPRLEHGFVDVLALRPELSTYLVNAGPELRYVVKLYDPAELDTLNADEGNLKRLHAAGLTVPEPLHVETAPSDFPCPYRIARFVEGYDLEEGLLTGRMDEELVPTMAKSLGEHLAKMHGINDAPRSDWASWLQSECLRGLEGLASENKLTADERNALAKRIEEGLGTLADVAPSAFLHGDLRLRHVLIEEGTHDTFFQGTIGHRRSMIGDPVWDFARLQHEVYAEEDEIEEPLREAYLEHASLPDDFDDRIALYSLCDQLLTATDKPTAPEIRDEMLARARRSL